MNENAITRKVLIEKQLGFAFYRSPYEVPDRIWRETFYSEDFTSLTNIESTCQYLASKILCPMLNTNESFIVSSVFYDHMTFAPYRKIIFEGLCSFEVKLELWMDLTSYMAGPDLLKDIVCIIWDGRITQPVYIFNIAVEHPTPQLDFTLGFKAH